MIRWPRAELQFKRGKERKILFLGSNHNQFQFLAHSFSPPLLVNREPKGVNSSWRWCGVISTKYNSGGYGFVFWNPFFIFNLEQQYKNKQNNLDNPDNPAQFCSSENKLTKGWGEHARYKEGKERLCIGVFPQDVWLQKHLYQVQVNLLQIYVLSIYQYMASLLCSYFVLFLSVLFSPEEYVYYFLTTVLTRSDYSQIYTCSCNSQCNPAWFYMTTTRAEPWITFKSSSSHEHMQWTHRKDCLKCCDKL